MENGIHYDIGEDEYHALPFASKSSIWRLNSLLEVCEDHETWKRLFEKPIHKDAFAFGNYLDDLLTGDVGDKYIEGPTKTQGVKHKALALTTDKTVLCLGEMDRGKWIADQVRAHPLGRTIFNDAAKYQAVLIWEDERTGIKCKARLDVLGETVDPETGDVYPTITDLKKTGKSLDKFRFDANDYGYFIQAAHYRDGLNVLQEDVATFRRFLFFAVEDAPFEGTGYHRMGIFEYGETEMANALAVRDRLLDQYKIFKDGGFPSKGYSIRPLTLSDWDLAKFGGEV